METQAPPWRSRSGADLTPALHDDAAVTCRSRQKVDSPRRFSNAEAISPQPDRAACEKDHASRKFPQRDRNCVAAACRKTQCGVAFSGARHALRLPLAGKHPRLMFLRP